MSSRKRSSEVTRSRGAKRTGVRTAPTTVRFIPELLAWVREMGELHPHGQAGVINDAVAAAMREQRRRARRAEELAQKIYVSVEAASGTEH